MTLVPRTGAAATENARDRIPRSSPATHHPDGVCFANRSSIGAPQNRDLAQPCHHLVSDDTATVFRGHNQMVVERVNAMELFDEMRLTCHATKRIISP
jgi:hypothetical protein